MDLSGSLSSECNAGTLNASTHPLDLSVPCKSQYQQASYYSKTWNLWGQFTIKKNLKNTESSSIFVKKNYIIKSPFSGKLNIKTSICTAVTLELSYFYVQNQSALSVGLFQKVAIEDKPT